MKNLTRIIFKHPVRTAEEHNIFPLSRSIGLTPFMLRIIQAHKHALGQDAELVIAEADGM
jgi:hypothetical protein